MADGARPVLIGYDGSEIAKQAISIAGELFLGDTVDRFDDAAADAADTIAESGVTLAAAAGLSARASTALSQGSAWLALDELAEEVNAVAIVVAARGLSGAKSVLLGSTSAGLVHHSSRPVIVVPAAHG